MLAATESSSVSTSSDEPHRMLWNTASCAPRDAEDLEHGVLADRHVIAHELAERAFVAPLVGQEPAFDDDLGRRRHHEVDMPARPHLDRLAGELGGDLEFVGIVGDAARRR